MNESIANIIAAAINNNPLEVRNAIDIAINEKVAAALEAHKITIAKGLVAVEGFKRKGSDKDVDEPALRKKGFGDVGKGSKKEDISREDLINFLNEEYEIDIQDEEELDLILEDFSEEEMDLILENCEQSLNELGKATLKSYTAKAGASISNSLNQQKPNIRVNSNRWKGLGRANSKLMK